MFFWTSAHVRARKMLLILLLCSALVAADIYLCDTPFSFWPWWSCYCFFRHQPRGSNNRLNERGRGRDNENRLFDSQNNDRGGQDCFYRKELQCEFFLGYNVGSVYYYQGSNMYFEWTNQHSCGQVYILSQLRSAYEEISFSGLFGCPGKQQQLWVYSAVHV